MMTQDRLTREDWIAVARIMLAKAGVDGVKVDAAARSLRVTRGSFYHHFKNRQDLLDTLIEDWTSRNRSEIVAMRAEQMASGMTRMFHIWLGEELSFPTFEIAVRVWARKSRKVAALVREIDDAWVALLQDLFELGGMQAPESFVRARIMHFPR
jgi:AcrR family transcriptional regulator